MSMISLATTTRLQFRHVCWLTVQVFHGWISEYIGSANRDPVADHLLTE